MAGLECKPRFSEVDQDKTGTITLDELMAYFTKVGIHDEAPVDQLLAS